MAISPLIPTSFVPRQPTDAGQRTRRSGANLFLIVSIGILAIAAIAAGGTFGYEKYLQSVNAADAAKLATAKANVNPSTVEDFVHLSDRFASAEGMLDNHIALSQFLDTLESATLSSVRFDDLTVQVADDRSAKVTMTGAAKSFNSLAAQSAAFANTPIIKRALFSDFDVDKTGAVTFSASFDLDSKAVVGNPAAALAAASVTASSSASTTPAVPAASTTPATSTLPAGGSPASSSPPAQPPTL